MSWRVLTLAIFMCCQINVPRAHASEGELTIKISSGNQPLVGAYAALVAEKEPWSRPLREAILVESAEVSFRVPAGTYRLVVAAKNHWWERRSGLVLEAGSPKIQNIELRSLDRLEGRVLTLDGSPIAGAKVGNIRAFLHHTRSQLSAHAEDYLRLNWETTTGVDGSFSLPALAGHRHSAIIEAELFEPGVIDNQWVKKGKRHSHEVRLARGASLKVTWPAAESAGILQLKAVEKEDFLQNLPMITPELIWERRAEKGVIQWPSLPAGTYQLHWVEDSQRGSAPQLLGTYVLGSGEVGEVEGTPIENGPRIASSAHQ